MLCKLAPESKTMMQIVENAVFLHIELGISAGFPRDSCTCIQITKRGINAADTDSNVMFTGSCMLTRLPVITLSTIRMSIHKAFSMNEAYAKT